MVLDTHAASKDPAEQRCLEAKQASTCSVPHPPRSPPSSEDTDINHIELTPGASERPHITKGSVSSKTSTSSGARIAKNVRNIRDSLGEEGYYFEDEESYNKYPELKQEVERIFCRERGSVMRTESLQAIK